METLKKYNWPLLLSGILLSSLSVTVLYSLSDSLARQQLMFMLIGVLMFFVCAYFGVSFVEVYWKHSLFFINLLLLATFVIGREVKGASRWLSVGGLNLQPSEVAKILVILSTALVLGNRKKETLESKNFIKSLIVFLPATLLVLIQPDLGTSLVFAACYLALLLLSRVNKLVLITGFICFGLFSFPLWNLLHDYQKNRLIVLVNPNADPKGAGYNVLQSRIAVGSGMLLGKGYGHGTQSKLKFLPEHHTDFIFASFAEEWGFVGVSILLILYFFLLLQILKIVSMSDSGMLFLASSGFYIMFLFQVVVNIGMNIGILPVTGITLPFMSYGGSSLVASFASLGFLNSIWDRARRNSKY